MHNDVIIYDISDDSWYKPEVEGDLPPKSMLHTATKVKKDGKAMMLIFGGVSKSKDGYVYVLHFKTMKCMEWAKIDNVNYKRCGHTANILGKAIFLFGGNYMMSSYFNDV